MTMNTTVTTVIIVKAAGGVGRTIRAELLLMIGHIAIMEEGMSFLAAK